MSDAPDAYRVCSWLERCLPGATIQSCTAEITKRCDEREVWDCVFAANGTATAGVLTIFMSGACQSVNTNLPPHLAAEKCRLAMSELPTQGIPTPHVLGHGRAADQAALLCEKIERRRWDPDARIQAAGILARLHSLSQISLSGPLQDLARISDPREYRITGGLAPEPEYKTLVHGDYFSANILVASDGLRIIDWETFGWGDPMWDLGFLVGADRDLPVDEVCATIGEYQKHAPLNRDRLRWHQDRWSDYWTRGH